MMMEALENLFEQRELHSFDAQEHQIHCLPHTVNISTGHVIKPLTLATNEDEQPNDYVPAENYNSAVCGDPIGRAHVVIKAICTSGTHREAFSNVIKDENRDGWFRHDNQVVQLAEVQLL